MLSNYVYGFYTLALAVALAVDLSLAPAVTVALTGAVPVDADWNLSLALAVSLTLVLRDKQCLPTVFFGGTQKNRPTVSFRGTRKYRYCRKFSECCQIMYTGFTYLQRFGKITKKLHTTTFCNRLHFYILSLAVRVMYCSNKTVPVALKSFQNKLDKKNIIDIIVLRKISQEIYIKLIGENK